MSFEPMPSSFDAWKTHTPDQDPEEHVQTCPLHEDNHDGEPAVCKCPTPPELKAEAAELREDR